MRCRLRRVDLETSAVFSAAKCIGMERLSLIHIWGELTLGRRWSDPLPSEVDVYRRSTEEAMFEIALKEHPSVTLNERGEGRYSGVLASVPLLNVVKVVLHHAA